MDFFSIDHIAFEVLQYKISYIELIGTLFGLICTYYASRANVWTWPTSIVNEIFLFILFFQVQLYADMFLQVYFFITTLYGWYIWKSNKAHVPITSVGKNAMIRLTVLTILGTLVAGYCITHIHEWLPGYFKLPAAYPYADSFVLVASILANILLARKQIENWYLWIAVDIISTVLYFIKGVYFLSLEYAIFLGIVSYGLYKWKKELKHV
jgi:nicotinamide mononucleotide transporter